MLFSAFVGQTRPPLQPGRVVFHVLNASSMEASMNIDTSQRRNQRQLLDVPSAAYLAGFSSRHFRRIIEEDHIPVREIQGKFFIVARDLEEWKVTRGDARLQAAIQQLDGWIKRSAIVDETPVEEDETE